MMRKEKMMNFETGPVIAAIRDSESLKKALASGAELIFDLTPNVLTLKDKVAEVHKANKKIFIHLDLAEGIGKDRAGIEFCKLAGVDGIISTRSNLIKQASEANLLTVQRFFIIDSHSVGITVDTLKTSKADMIEVMPGVVPKVIESLKQNIKQPIIAGGLIDKKSEIIDAIKSGASAISTGADEFWEE